MLKIFILPKNYVLERMEEIFVARLIPQAKNIFADKIGRFFNRMAFEDCIFLSDEMIKETYSSNEEKIAINQQMKKLGRNEHIFD
jgi:hypothetical protein